MGAEGAPRSHREGVLWDEASQTDILFITLRKSEALFSPSTRTSDLALGPSLFHWESQSTTTASSPTGQRYIHHEARGSRVLLLVRVAAGFCAAVHRRQDGRPGDVTESFRCLGFARYAGHEGERLMAIRWRLEREMPAACPQSRITGRESTTQAHTRTDTLHFNSSLQIHSFLAPVMAIAKTGSEPRKQI